MSQRRPLSVFLGSSGKRIAQAQEFLPGIDASSVSERFRVFEALLKEARDLAVLPRENPLEGLETVKKIARIISSVH